MADELSNYTIGDSPRTYQLSSDDAKAVKAKKVNGAHAQADDPNAPINQGVAAPANKQAPPPAAK